MHKKIVAFLRDIGLDVRTADLSQETFLPGITIENGVLIYDPVRLAFPGDLLHEAGHLAFTPTADRARCPGMRLPTWAKRSPPLRGLTPPPSTSTSIRLTYFTRPATAAPRARHREFSRRPFRRRTDARMGRHGRRKDAPQEPADCIPAHVEVAARLGTATEQRGLRISNMPRGLALLLIFPAACAPLADSVSRPGNIPIDLHSGHAYVRVSVNGSEPLWFLLDTDAAAPFHLIARNRAIELGLASQNSKVAGAIGGTVTVQLTAPVRLKIGQIDLGEQQLATIDLGDSESQEGHAVDGILGYPFFRDHVVTIDYRRHLLLIDTLPNTGASAGVVPLEIQGKTPVVEAHLSIGKLSRHPVRLAVDTGFDDTLILNRPFVLKHELQGSADTAHGSGASLGGETRSELANARELLLGSLSYRDTKIRLSLDTEGAFSSSNMDGFIGALLLQDYAVTFDYGHGTMTLWRLP